MVKKNIYFLHPLGEEFTMGYSGNEINFKYTNEIMGKIFKLQERKDKICLYGDYTSDMSDEEMEDYLADIYDDKILHNVLKGDGLEACELTSYMIGTNYITVAIDEKSTHGKLLLDIMKTNSVFVTFIMHWENKQVVGLRNIALCIGYMNRYILFI